jgi:Mg2+ and Co2+ transporter CorA
MELPKFSENWSAASKRPKNSIVDDIIDCWDQSTPECFDPSDPTIQSLAFYPLKIVAAEWVKYIAVMQDCIKMYEYHGHQLPGLEKVSTDLRELQGWRRRSMASQQKINFIIRKLECHDVFNKQHHTSIDDLLEDYRVIGSDIETAGRRLENMLPVLASLVQIIDARQSFAETANISRLTVLALLFVPLSYVSSLFSMNPDNGPGGSHFWVYFAVAVPITIFVFVVARPPTWALRAVAEWMWGRRRQRKVLELLNETKGAAA